MSIFGTIMSKIFGHSAAAQPSPPPPAAGSSGTSAAPAKPAAGGTASSAAPPAAPGASAAPAKPAAGAPASSPAASAAPGSRAATPAGSVDVAAVLTSLAAKNKEKLDWRKSIVDLMKLLDLDSSLAARKQLAQELHYGGDTNDSATMNVWLHKQVMIKLAENSGKVPPELLS